MEKTKYSKSTWIYNFVVYLSYDEVEDFKNAKFY